MNTFARSLLGLLLAATTAVSLAATVYTYDELNRLTKVVYDDGRSIAYSYDAAGNLVSELRVGTAAPSGLVGHWTFDNCDAKDSSPNANHGVFSGGPVCVTGKFGKALRFNGSTDWITVPSSASFPKTALTLSYWIHREGRTPASTPPLQNYLSKEHAFQSYLYPSGGMTSGLWMGGPWSQYGDAVLLPTSTDWVHYAFTFDNTTRTARTYVNGVLRETKVDADVNAVVRQSNNALFIGRNGSANVYHIVGLMDDVRVYDRALAPAEIEAAFQGVGTTTLELPASAFTNGLNVAINTEPGNSCRNGLLYNAPPYQPLPNAATWIMNVASAGDYLIEVDYAAQESRPVVFKLDGVVKNQTALAEVTGGWCVSNVQRRSLGTHFLNAGSHALTFERASVFPHFWRIRATRTSP